MYSYIFKEKLRKLNPALYLKEDNAIARAADVRASGIYNRTRKRTDIKSGYGQLDFEGRQFLEAQESGNSDVFVTGCPTGWIPEYDEMNLESGRIVQKGWRTIVLHLIKERLCTEEKARRIFSPSLGETQWDRAGYDGRLAMQRKAAGYKTAREQLAATWGM
jgi:hypothetical protein